MAVPKKKTSKSRRNMRRSHDALTAANVVINSSNGSVALSHKIDSEGTYNGRKVVYTTAELAELSGK
jgi:large subunit ribosomal protein L32